MKDNDDVKRSAVKTKNYAFTALKNSQPNWLVSSNRNMEWTLMNTINLMDNTSTGTQSVLESFLEVLSPHSHEINTQGRDFDIIKRAISSIYEAVGENILTENEASDLIEFIASKFIERRFDSIINDVFDVGTRRHHIKLLRGMLK